MTLEDFVGDTDLAVRGQLQGQFNHCCLDPRIHAVLQQRTVMGDFLQGRFSASVVQFLKTVEAVARIAHYTAGLTDVAKLSGKLKNADFGADDFLFLKSWRTPCSSPTRVVASGYALRDNTRRHEKPTTVRFSLVHCSAAPRLLPTFAIQEVGDSTARVR